MTIFNLLQLCCVIILILVNIYYCKLYIYIRKKCIGDRTTFIMCLLLFGVIHLYPLIALYASICWFFDGMGVVINPKPYWDAFINFKII